MLRRDPIFEASRAIAAASIRLVVLEEESLELSSTGVYSHGWASLMASVGSAFVFKCFLSLDVSVRSILPIEPPLRWDFQDLLLEKLRADLARGLLFDSCRGDDIVL